VDGDVLSVVLISGPAHGVLMLNADGSFSYTPTGTFSGTDSFQYAVSDGVLISGMATVELQISQTLTSAGGSAGGAASGGGSGTTSSGTSTDDPKSTTNTSGDSPSTTDSVTPAGPRAGLRSAAGNVDPEALQGAAEVTEEIVRRTSSEQFIAIFLDEVPDESELKEGASTRRAANEERNASRSTSGTYLFGNVETSAPLFTGKSFDVNQEHVAAQQNVEQKSKMMDTVVIGSTAAVSTSVTVGYVMWLLRGGSLLTTFLSSLPAWQAFDPLPVLEQFESDENEDDESLSAMIDARR
jgi:hypothetical protein